MTTRELPILMADWTARATIQGRKTETRRVVTHGTCSGVRRTDWDDLDLTKAWCHHLNFPHHLNVPSRSEPFVYRLEPRWKAGDRLYVRQAWAPLDGVEDPGVLAIAEGAFFRCDYPDGLPNDVERWRPSIHMPKRLARSWLRVESVRVERLQAMTDVEAIAEGCPGHSVDGHAGYPDGYHPLDEFQEKWDALNATRGYGWDTNPWVVVLCYSA